MRELADSRPRSLIGTIKAHGVLLLSLLGIMWAMEIVDLLPYIQLDRFGIRPRSLAGLPGILFTPFLHDGFRHLLANSVPFIFLGGVVLLGGLGLYWRVTIFVVVVGGFGVWLFAGRLTNHIGASGLIFGYLGFLLTRGVFEKSLPWIIGGCVVLVAYGSLLLSVLPTHEGVSWQGHLFGFLAGVGAARLLFRGGKKVLLNWR